MVQMVLLRYIIRVRHEDELILQTQKINRYMYDVELYAYAKQLYREQEDLLWAGSGNGGIIDGGGLRHRLQITTSSTL